MEKNYSVGYDVAEDLTHGIKAHSVIVADFVYPQDAEDFIVKCIIPLENQQRFFVEAKFDEERIYPVK